MLRVRWYRVPGAKLSLLNTETGFTAETFTTGTGLYVFASVPVGAYTLTAEMDGFKRLVQSNLIVQIAARLVVDMQLEVGQIVETIDVVDTPPLLETTRSERGDNFSPQMMQTLPLFTGGIRRGNAFTRYMPGVNTANGQVSVNGSGGRAKEILIDGASLTIPESGGVVFSFPAVEMFGEFKLVSSTYSADNGRFGGGIEVFHTKSGTNQLHGAGFWNIRRDIFNAAGWTINSNPNNPPGFRPKQRFTTAGGAIGGPVWLPKVYDGRNKTFWYFTIARDLRPATAAPVISSVATSLMKQGNFSEIGRTIYDPATTDGDIRLPFPNQTIPQERMSGVSRNILAVHP